MLNKITQSNLRCQQKRRNVSITRISDRFTAINILLISYLAEEYFKTEVDTDISAEYAEGEEDKTYQTETDGDEMAESGSQDNGKTFSIKLMKRFP